MKAFNRALSIPFLLLGFFLAACERAPEREDSLAMANPSDAEAGESVLAAALSRDGSYAAYSLIDGSASVWDVSQREEIRRWPTAQFGGGAKFLEFVGGGELLLMAGIDYSVIPSERSEGALNYIMVWNIFDGSTRRIWTMKGARLTAVSPSGDGSKILAGFSNGMLVIFDDSNASRSDYLLHNGKVTDVALSPDGRYAFTGAVDGKAHYWSVANGEILKTFTHRNRVTNVAANSDFSVGFTSDALDNQRLWDLRTGNLVSPLQHHQRWMFIADVRFSQNDDHLLVASPSSAVSMWNAQDGSNIARRNSDFPAVGVAENALGNLVSVGSTGVVDTWKVQ